MLEFLVIYSAVVAAVLQPALAVDGLGRAPTINTVHRGQLRRASPMIAGSRRNVGGVTHKTSMISAESSNSFQWILSQFIALRDHSRLSMPFGLGAKDLEFKSASEVVNSMKSAVLGKLEPSKRMSAASALGDESFNDLVQELATYHIYTESGGIKGLIPQHRLIVAEWLAQTPRPTVLDALARASQSDIQPLREWANDIYLKSTRMLLDTNTLPAKKNVARTAPAPVQNEEIPMGLAAIKQFLAVAKPVEGFASEAALLSEFYRGLQTQRFPHSSSRGIIPPGFRAHIERLLALRIYTPFGNINGLDPALQPTAAAWLNRVPRQSLLWVLAKASRSPDAPMRDWARLVFADVAKNLSR